MEYKILNEDNYISLQRKVNEYIQQGRKPIGGVAVVRRDVGSYDFYQSLIK